MAWVRKRTDRKSGDLWEVGWREPDGRQRKRSFRRKIDADAYVDTLRIGLRRGDYVDPDAGRVTVRQWSEQWIAAQTGLKDSTRNRYAGLLRARILPRWGDTPLSAVGHAGVAAWVADMSAGGAAAGTVRQAHRVLSLVLAMAVRDGRLTRNVADKVPLPRAVREAPRFLTPEEVDRLASVSREPFTVRFLALTGLRFGELVALRVGAVSLDRRRLLVRESATEVGGRLIWSAPKTHAERSVPIARSLLDGLAERCAGRADDALVFTAARGGPVRLRGWRRDVFDPAARAAGLEGVTPHDLRHACASFAIAAGATVKDVQRMLGHASASMTLDVYATLWEDRLDDVADRLDSVVTQGLPGA